MEIFGIIIVVVTIILVFSIWSYMLSPKGMERRLTKMGNIVAKAQNNIINNNQDIMKDSATKTANINKEAVKTYAHSIKEGFEDIDTIYCKHCGIEIDSDSTFCKKCGKQV